MNPPTGANITDATQTTRSAAASARPTRAGYSAARTRRGSPDRPGGMSERCWVRVRQEVQTLLRGDQRMQLTKHQVPARRNLFPAPPPASSPRVHRRKMQVALPAVSDRSPRKTRRGPLRLPEGDALREWLRAERRPPCEPHCRSLRPRQCTAVGESQWKTLLAALRDASVAATCGITFGDSGATRWRQRWCNT